MIDAKKKYFFFVLIVLVNIVLKSLYAGHVPFSYDEIISVKDTLLDFGHIKHESEWDNNPPFYYYCLWVWHQLIPINEFNARLLSVLFVSFAIGLTYLFAQKYFDAKTAFFSAALLSLSNFLTFYAQETRTYALVLLLTISSTLLFFRYIKKPGIGNLLILSLINFLIIYSHYIAGMVVLMQYIMILLFHRPLIKIYFPVQTVFILLLVFLRFTKKQFLNIINYNHKKDFWLKPATYSDLTNALSELFFNPVTAIVFLIILVALVYNLWKHKATSENYEQQFYCFLLGFTSIAALFFIGTFKALFLPRYLIFCIPFATLLIVWQATRLKTAGAVFILILICYSLYTLDLKKKADADYREMADVIRQNKKAGDHVIINTRDNLLLFEYYYNKPDFMKYSKVDSVCNTQHIYGLNNTEQLNGLDLKPNAAVFLIQSYHKINTAENHFDTYLSNKLNTVYFKENKGLEFHIYKNN